MKLTLDSLRELLTLEGVNSKDKVAKALKQANSNELIGFRNDIDKHIALKVIEEREIE